MNQVKYVVECSVILLKEIKKIIKTVFKED